MIGGGSHQKTGSSSHAEILGSLSSCKCWSTHARLGRQAFWPPCSALFWQATEYREPYIEVVASLLRLTLVLKVTTDSGRHLNHTQIRTLSACRMTLLDSCSVRHFGELAMGTINNSAKDRKSERTLTLDSNNTLVETTPRDWDPQNMMMILDGLDAIRWAWTFIQIGDEADINEFIDKFCRITRQHQQRLLQVTDSWETFTWQLAIKMRSGATFSKATKELLADTTTMNDILSQPAKKQPRTETRRPQNNSSQFRQPKGRGKNTWGNKGYQTTSYPYNNQPYATWGPTLFANPAIPSMPTTPGPSFKGDTPKGKKGSGKGKKGTKSHGKNKAR